jgi:HlyD family secretion protein
MRPTKTTLTVMLALPALGATAWLTPRHRQAAGPVAVARQGALTERLVESGTVSSARLLLYGSSISGVQVKIAELAPEGQAVAPGDLLVRFDSTVFEQNLAREEAALRQAEGELSRAGDELRIERLHGLAEAAEIEQQVSAAKSDLSDQTDGKGRVTVAEVEAAENDAAAEVDRARATVEDMRPMLERGFITRTELDRAEQALRRSEEQLKLARVRREAVVVYERPAAIGRARTGLDSAQQAVSRQRETGTARLAEREAAQRIAASRIDEIRARVALLRDQIAHTTVLAEASGMIVYRELFFGNDKRKPQVGDEVWSNQPLMALPDSARLTVETRIREIDLHHVATGSHVNVKVPAYPGLELAGTVTLVGALADQDPSHAGAKFFPLTVTLDGGDDRLRVGMTAEVEIETATISQAVLVPVQAVFDVDGRPTVYVGAGSRVGAREVAIAAENEREAAVVSGVAVGESVLLSNPHASFTPNK